ncbi:MAG: hypothetical protein IJB96_03300 [Lachnospira sp.]|nr:hypothetical protein [Lachnospira sp.]
MFPDVLDGAKVLYFTPKDDYGVMYDTLGNVVAHFKYLSICKYDNSEGYYLFDCDENYEVVSDSVWESIEMCMSVARSSYGESLLWIES